MTDCNEIEDKLKLLRDAEYCLQEYEYINMKDIEPYESVKRRFKSWCDTIARQFGMKILDYRQSEVSDHCYEALLPMSTLPETITSINDELTAIVQSECLSDNPYDIIFVFTKEDK